MSIDILYIIYIYTIVQSSLNEHIKRVKAKSNQYIRNHREKYIQSEMFSNNANASASNNTRVYQRQEELQGWDQNLVASLTCLVLGVGGLGSHISSGLCRLGVIKNYIG
jgi:cysteine synthase